MRITFLTGKTKSTFVNKAKSTRHNLKIFILPIFDVLEISKLKHLETSQTAKLETFTNNRSTKVRIPKVIIASELSCNKGSD